jgi:hypothetical protein
MSGQFRSIPRSGQKSLLDPDIIRTLLHFPRQISSNKKRLFFVRPQLKAFTLSYVHSSRHSSSHFSP